MASNSLNKSLFTYTLMLVMIASYWPTNAQSSKDGKREARQFVIPDNSHLYRPLPAAKLFPAMVADGRLYPSYSRQQQFGPFFGYFSNLFGQQCPTCPSNPPCPVLPACPASSISNQLITECFPPTPSEPFLTAATNGTIKLSMTVPSVCVYGIVTPLPYDQVVVKCSAMNAGSSFQVSPLATGTLPGGLLDTPYTSQNNYLQLTLTGVPVASAAANNAFFTCSWETQKGVAPV